MASTFLSQTDSDSDQSSSLYRRRNPYKSLPLLDLADLSVEGLEVFELEEVRKDLQKVISSAKLPFTKRSTNSTTQSDSSSFISSSTFDRFSSLRLDDRRSENMDEIMEIAQNISNLNKNKDHPDISPSGRKMRETFLQSRRDPIPSQIQSSATRFYKYPESVTRKYWNSSGEKIETRSIPSLESKGRFDSDRRSGETKRHMADKMLSRNFAGSKHVENKWRWSSGNVAMEREDMKQTSSSMLKEQRLPAKLPTIFSSCFSSGSNFEKCEEDILDVDFEDFQLINGPVLRKCYQVVNEAKVDHSRVDNIGINEPALSSSEMNLPRFFHQPDSGPSADCPKIEYEEKEVRQSYLQTMKELEVSLKCRENQNKSKLFNLKAVHDSSPLIPLPNENGDLPLYFPDTRKNYFEMSEHSKCSLLSFYGLPLSPRINRLSRLGSHLGVPPDH